jgi:membrane protease YdiL (CAAX protease family)
MLAEKPVRAIILLIISNFLLLAVVVFVSTLFPVIIPLINQLIQILLTFALLSLLVFLIVPFIYKLPQDYASFSGYLRGIRLPLSRPYARILLFTLISYVTFVLCQLAGSFLYGQYTFDVTRILPPNSYYLLNINPALFEEIMFRGIIFTILLAVISKRRSLILSAVLFGLVHFTNLLHGVNPDTLLYTSAQVLWACGMGFFWGYLVQKTDSIIPGIILHYLSNALDPLWLFVPTLLLAVDLLYKLVFAKFLPLLLSILLIELLTNPKSPMCIQSYLSSS